MRWHFVSCAFSTFWLLTMARDNPNASDTAAPSTSSDAIGANFHIASRDCYRRENLPANYESAFARFQYADEPQVHRYLHCVWTELGLWTDSSGFAVERIAHLYRQRANTEVLVPTLTNCNRNTARAPPAKWCYTSTICILESRVGQWFKDDMARKTLPNGH